MTAPSHSDASVHRPAAIAGPVRFARYAYGPNRLGYCGPDEERELFDQATRGREDAVLRSLAARFEGAYPYLELIARSAGIADPLDVRVVEAYWLGSDLLDRVRPAALGADLERRFRPRTRIDGWRRLAAKPSTGAVPNHAFHVLDVFPVVGLLRGGPADDVLAVMDACRIRWGRVIERDGDWLVVNVVPLTLVAGRLELGPPRVERVRGWRDGVGFLGGGGGTDAVGPNDVVSIHWDWACERLDGGTLSRLIGWTRRELATANLTI